MVDKAKVNSTNYEFNDNSEEPNNSIGQFTTAINQLKSTIDNVDHVFKQSITQSSELDFLQGVANTRDASSLLNDPTIKAKLDESFNAMSTMYQTHSNSLSNFYNDVIPKTQSKNKSKRQPIEKKPKKEQHTKHWFEKVVEYMHGQSHKLAHPMGHELSHTFHADNPLFEGVAQGLTSSTTNLTSNMGNLISNVLQLGDGLKNLTLIGSSMALGGAALGISSALEGMDLDESYRLSVMQSNPEAYGSITDPFQDKMSFRQDMIDNLIGVKSGKDADSLYNTAMSTRPGAGTTDETVQGMAGSIGLLSDIGVNATPTLTNLQHGFGMGAGESLGTVAGLTRTGVDNNLMDISGYMGQILSISNNFRGMGVTVAQVDGVFNKFTKKTFTGGVKLAADQAMSLTELQIGIQKKISTATAGMIGLTQGANLNVGSSFGLKGGENIGQMMKSGDPVQAFLATQYIKQGANIDGIYDSIASHYQDTLKMTAPNASHDEQMARLYMMMSKEGSVQGDFSDDKVRALLDDIITHKKGSEKLKKHFEEVAPKPLPEMIKDFQDKAMVPGLKTFYKDVEKMDSPLEGIGRIWMKIRQMLGGIFLPAVEESAIILSGLGSFLHTFFKTGNLSSAAGAFSHSYSEVQHGFREANSTGTLNAMINSNSIAHDFMLKLGLLEEHDVNHSVQKQFTKAMNEGFKIGTLHAVSSDVHVGKDKSAYLAMAKEAAHKYGIPENLLISQIQAESNFNPNAKSGAGAVGIAQIVPKYHPNVNAHDPHDSIDYMAKLMKSSYNTYKRQGHDDQTAYSLALSAYNCFDDQTEVLTDNGWVLFKDLKESDNVASYNNLNLIEYDKPLNYYEYDYNGIMHHYKNLAIDAMVTPNHKMLTKVTPKHKFKLIESKEINWKSCILPVAAGNNNQELSVSDEEIKITAWILTDGTIAQQKKKGLVAKKPKIRIYQTNPKAQTVFNLLDALGWDYYTYEVVQKQTHIQGKKLVKKPKNIYHITLKPNSRDKALRLLTTKKQIPKWVYNLSHRQFDLFINTFIDGDGSRPKGLTNFELSGTHNVMDELQILLIQNGYKAKVKKITDNTSRLYGCIKSETRILLKNRYDTFYTGKVYCVSTKNQTVVTRRCGKVLISGNSGSGNVAKMGKGIYKGGIKETSNYVDKIMSHGLKQDFEDLNSSLAVSNPSINYNQGKNGVHSVTNIRIRNKQTGKVIKEKQISNVG